MLHETERTTGESIRQTAIYIFRLATCKGRCGIVTTLVSALSVVVNAQADGLVIVVPEKGKGHWKKPVGAGELSTAAGDPG